MTTTPQDQIEKLQQRVAELEATVSECEEQFRALTDAAPVGLYMDDLDGNAIYINRKCAELVGIPAENALNFGWIPYLHPDDREEMVAKWTEAFTNRTAFRSEYRWVHDDGEIVWTLGEAVPVPGPDGEVSLFIGTLTDITPRKKAEEERRRLQADLLQAQKLESVGRLAGGVAHDSNNMLNVILGHAELALLSVSPDDPLRHDLQAILHAAQRSADVTRQLLTFARKQSVSPRVCDVNIAVGTVLDMLRRLIGKDIELVWSPQKEEAPVMIDPFQLDQVVMNLCMNGCDAIDGRGTLTIGTSTVTVDEEQCAAHEHVRPGPFIKLSVTDDGSGMDEDVIAHIFEPFFTTKDKHSGTGLGLSNVYGIVEQNGGLVRVASEVGIGSTFDIYLPLQSGGAPMRTVSAPDTVQMGNGELVLVLEDESSILGMVERILTRWNFKVLVASTPTEAFQLVDEHKADLDLLITDVIMPEMDGRTLIDRLRADIPDLKYLFMSGHDANTLFRKGMVEDGGHLIQKPFRMEDFISKVHAVLNA